MATTRAERQELTGRLRLAGTLVPYEQVTLYAKVTGYLKSLKVDIGDRVRKGQLLAEIEAPEMENALGEKRAALLKAGAALEQARALVGQTRSEVEFAEINYHRLKAIHDSDADVLPQQDVDQARSNLGIARGKWKGAEAQVQAADSAIAGAKAELATLQTMIGYATIQAPMAGVITERFVDPGALIQSGTSSRSQAARVVSIARIDRLRIVVDVPELNVASIQPGTPATIEAANLPAESFPARVARIAKVLDPGSRTMRAEIDVTNPAERLRPGMTAQVSLVVKKIEKAVTVPLSALRSYGEERAVFAVEQGRARRVKVKTGPRTGSRSPMACEAEKMSLWLQQDR